MLRSLKLVVLFAFLVAPFGPACDNTTDVAPIPSDGTLECEDLGKVCHDAGLELGGEYDECHDVGHANDGEECLRVYDDCIALCAAAHLGEGGAGGEGGHREGGAAGHHEGGAAAH